MRAVVQMIHEGFNWLGFTILVLMMVILLPGGRPADAGSDSCHGSHHHSPLRRLLFQPPHAELAVS